MQMQQRHDSSSFPVTTASDLEANLSPETSEQRLQLIWSNVSYTVSRKKSLFSRERERTVILNNVSGCVTAGTVTAAMGPSGAGKTTLISLITGRIRGVDVTGTVSLLNPVEENESNGNNRKLRIRFVAQQENLFSAFTVTESILFASKVNNPLLTPGKHKDKTTQVLTDLDLDSQSDSKVAHLSGGQRKRVAIALELISDPQILVLDEPTTGLDSTNSETVVQVLRNISRCSSRTVKLSPPAIITTIHTPSADACKLFHQIYLLNRNGENIFSGPVDKLMAYMTSSFAFAPKTGNPADFAIEIANAKYGDDKFEAMAQSVRQEFADRNWMHDTKRGKRQLLSIVEVNEKPMCGWFRQFSLLSMRLLAGRVIKSPVLLMRVAAMLFQVFGIVHLSRQPIGHIDGCLYTTFPSFHGLNGSTTSDSSAFDSRQQMDDVSSAMFFSFLSCLSQMLICAFVQLSVWPQELLVTGREVCNNWYRVSALFAALVLNEVIATTIGAIAFVGYAFSFAHLPSDDAWDKRRLLLILTACALIGIIWSMRAVFFTTLLHPTIALSATFALLISSTFFSGFFVRLEIMTAVMQTGAHISDCRHGFAIILIAMFGYGRCKADGSSSRLASHLVQQVLTQESLVDIYSNLWLVLNVTDREFRPLERQLNLTSGYFSPLTQAMDQYFASQEKLRAYESQQYNPSFVLQTYGLHESHVLPSFLWLIGLLFLSLVLAYTALFSKFRDRRF